MDFDCYSNVMRVCNGCEAVCDCWAVISNREKIKKMNLLEKKLVAGIVEKWSVNVQRTVGRMGLLMIVGFGVGLGVVVWFLFKGKS